LLLLCGADGCAERSLNLGLLSAHSHLKHTAEPVHFGTPPALSRCFGQSLCLLYCLKRFGGTIRQVQCLSLYCEKIGQAQHRAGCPIVSDSVLDPGDTLGCTAGNAARPSAKNLSSSQAKRKSLTCRQLNQLRGTVFHFRRITLKVAE